jgi:hypothetical protein
LMFFFFLFLFLVSFSADLACLLARGALWSSRSCVLLALLVSFL